MYKSELLIISFKKSFVFAMLTIFTTNQTHFNQAHAMGQSHRAHLEESLRRDESHHSNPQHIPNETPPLKSIITQLLKLTNEHYQLTNKTPDQIWKGVAESRLYKVGRFITMTSTFYLSHSCVITPTIRALFLQCSSYYNTTLGCDYENSAQGDDLGYLCDRTSKNIFLGVALFPVAFYLTKQVNKIAPMITNCTDRCSQFLISKVQQKKGLHNPERLITIETLIGEVSNQLIARSSEVRELPVIERKVIFYVATLNNQIELMKSVLRLDDQTESQVYNKLDLGDCSICLESLTQKDSSLRHLLRTDCDHIFHGACLKSWYERQPTCPLCRSPNSTEALNLLDSLWPLE